MTPIYEFDYQRTASPGERPPYSDVRLVRDLGILETSEDHSYHIDEMEDELAKTLINNRTEDEYLIFKADSLPVLPELQGPFMNFRRMTRPPRIIRSIRKDLRLQNILQIE